MGAAAGRAVRHPVAEVAVAAGLALFGAWLIAVWAIGLVVIVFAVLLGVDALLRDSGGVEEKSAPLSRHEEILERWRKAR